MGMLYPFKFLPVYKEYPWGNTVMPQRFGRSAPVGIYAESWEVSTHPDGESIIVNGSQAGKTLSAVLGENGPEILGSAVKGRDFPLLIKLIDAARPLSVQVHPNNENAAMVQGEPKSEMWYFLNEAPSRIYCGLTPGTTRADFLSAIDRSNFDNILRVVSVKKGGAAYVPGGRVHSIDAGCLLLEIQQNSNTTYRVYDWGRIGDEAQPRELHVEKAMQVINFDDVADPVCSPIVVSAEIRTICASPFFVLNELTVNGAMVLEASGQTFHVLFSAEGAFEIEYDGGKIESVACGTSVLIPAALGRYTLTAEPGLIVLQTSVPIH